MDLEIVGAGEFRGEGTRLIWVAVLSYDGMVVAGEEERRGRWQGF